MLLKRVGKVTINITDDFCPDCGEKGFCIDHLIEEANVYIMNRRFRRFFLEMVETDLDDELTLAVEELRPKTFSRNRHILAELDGRAEFGLTYFFKLLKMQANGEQGVLSTQEDNVMHARGLDGNLYTIRAHWGNWGKGWMLGALPIDHWFPWIAGHSRFFALCFVPPAE